MLLELERLYNHVTDLGALCNDVAHSILNAQPGRVREQLLRLNAEVTGHRLLRGGVVLGGAALRAVPDPERLTAIAADVAELADLALAHTVVADRFTGTAASPRRPPATSAPSATSPAPAASTPTPAATTPSPTCGPPSAVPTAHHRDVLARFQVRAEEIAVSAAISRTCAYGIAPGAVPAAPPRERRRPASGVGIVEGWRGTIVHRVELAADGTLARVKIVDPSFFNWPALPVP